MLLAARKAYSFTKDMSWERFQADEILQNGVMHVIQIVEEAAGKVSPEFRQVHQEIPWRQIVGMRHRLVAERAALYAAESET